VKGSDAYGTNDVNCYFVYYDNY